MLTAAFGRRDVVLLIDEFDSIAVRYMYMLSFVDVSSAVHLSVTRRFQFRSGIPSSGPLRRLELPDFSLS